MKSMTIVGRATCLGLAVLTLLAGCSTPDSRIRKNPSLFASFPPDAQMVIRQGQIGLGFTPEMVTMALGDPSTRTSEVSTEGVKDVWTYTDTYTTTERETVQPNPVTMDKDGNTRYEYKPPVTVDAQKVKEYDKIVIEFSQGRVVNFKTTTR